MRRRMCWWSLSTHLYHQYKSKRGRTTCFYTHIPLLLTRFYLYWKNYHFVGINTKYKGIVSKRRYSRKRRIANQYKWPKKPNQRPNLGQSTVPPWSRTTKQPTTRSRSRGGPAQAWPRPLSACPGPSSLWWFGIDAWRAVRWWIWGIFPWKPTIHPYIKKGELTHKHTPHKNLSPPHLYSFYYF
jgi:hypothetical protein